jgi:hypothetical protein
MTVEISKRLQLRDVVYMQVLIYYSRVIFQKVPWWNVLECSGRFWISEVM